MPVAGIHGTRAGRISKGAEPFHGGDVLKERSTIWDGLEESMLAGRVGLGTGSSLAWGDESVSSVARHRDCATH
jgi:hypothetical protein